MSENHMTNLVEKLAEFEARVQQDKAKRDERKFMVQEACKKNIKMTEISLLEEALADANNKLGYDMAMVASLRSKIKRASR